MSITKHVTLQKIVAHDFRYDPRTYSRNVKSPSLSLILEVLLLSRIMCCMSRYNCALSYNILAVDITLRLKW